MHVDAQTHMRMPMRIPRPSWALMIYSHMAFLRHYTPPANAAGAILYRQP